VVRERKDGSAFACNVESKAHAKQRYTYRDRDPQDSNRRAYRHSTRSRLFRLLRHPSSVAAERIRAEAGAEGSSLAGAGHRKPAEEGEGSNPVGADHRSLGRNPVVVVVEGSLDQY